MYRNVLGRLCCQKVWWKWIGQKFKSFSQLTSVTGFFGGLFRIFKPSLFTDTIQIAKVVAAAGTVVVVVVVVVVCSSTSSRSCSSSSSSSSFSSSGSSFYCCCGGSGSSSSSSSTYLVITEISPTQITLYECCWKRILKCFTSDISWVLFKTEAVLNVPDKWCSFGWVTWLSRKVLENCKNEKK